MGRLEGKRVLITGTGGGQATAEVLHPEGRDAHGSTVDLADPGSDPLLHDVAGVVFGERTLGFAAHAAAKGGVLAFTRQLAAEGVEVGIRANAISAGFIATPATEVVPPGYRQRGVERLHMLGREDEPEDIAPIALYLA